MHPRSKPYGLVRTEVNKVYHYLLLANVVHYFECSNFHRINFCIIAAELERDMGIAIERIMNVDVEIWHRIPSKLHVWLISGPPGAR